MRHPIFSFLGCLCLCYAVGFVGDQGANLGIASWYLVLGKPAWSPPVWLFAIVWTVHYGLSGVSLWMVRRAESRLKGVATLVFCIQLGLTGVWPWLFFAGHLLFFATAEILVLVIALALTLALFFRVSRTASLLGIPCLVWIAFLAALNFSIWRTNPNGAAVQVVSERANLPQNSFTLATQIAKT